MKVLVLALSIVLMALCEPAEGARRDIVGTAGAVNATSVGKVAEPTAGAAWTEAKTGMVFLWVPSGCFTMGSPAGESGRNLDEGPQHEVCLSGFWLGKTEVTQGQWRAIMGDNPSLIASGADYPVDMVSWDMAKAYAAALGKRTGESFRLPTEAEWEYACRADTTTPYAYGDAISHDQASFDKRYSLPDPTPRYVRTSPKSRRKKLIQPKVRIWPNMHTSVAGSFPANAFGLRDMHGNVWEWCEDMYDAGFYSRSVRMNPLFDGKGEARVLRGGSWVTKAETLRSANRSWGWPGQRTAFYGLRLVRPAVRPDARHGEAPTAADLTH